MNLHKHTEEAKLDLQIAPLIDVVFLLLIYFMVTAALVKKEGDISFLLPAPASISEVIDLPIEVKIEVQENGTVMVEGMTFDASDRDLEELIIQLKGSKAIADAQSARFFVNIAPSREALHSRIIDVMDACAAANVNSLTFSPAL